MRMCTCQTLAITIVITHFTVNSERYCDMLSFYGIELDSMDTEEMWF